MARIKSIAVILLAVIVLIVVVQNVETVTLRFLFWRLTLSRIVLLPLLFAAGFLTGSLVARLKQKRNTP